MKMQFATCNRIMALGFLQKLYPDSNITDTDNSAKAVLDMVEADIVRIPDPSMHGQQVAIYPSHNWVKTEENKNIKVLTDFHKQALKEAEKE